MSEAALLIIGAFDRRRLDPHRELIDAATFTIMGESRGQGCPIDRSRTTLTSLWVECPRWGRSAESRSEEDRRAKGSNGRRKQASEIIGGDHSSQNNSRRPLSYEFSQAAHLSGPQWFECDEYADNVANHSTIHVTMLSLTRISSLLLTTFFVCRSATAQEAIEPAKVTPLKQGLAENDFVQKRPLMAGLELGFRAFEADVFLVGERLTVGSSVLDMRSKGTFEDLYLAPLKQLHDSKSDLISNGDEPLLLFVEFKSPGRPAYRALQPLLARYSEILTTVKDDEPKQGAVTIILGGDVVRETVLIDNPRYVALDGHVADIESDAPSHLIPIISVRWGSYFRWDGRTNRFLAHERTKLNAMTQYVHEYNRKIRFRSTPDMELLWAELRSANVDYIGGERYLPLHKFLAPPASPFERDKPE